jgi:dephospho-CoA kinase
VSDADSIAHTVYEPGSQAVEDIVKALGSEILRSNGEIDRKKLGSIVFSDRDAMQTLERIVWPHVRRKIEDQIQVIRSEWDDDDGDDGMSCPIVVVEAAVLLDAGWHDILDGVWVVTAPHRVALRRLVESRGLSREEAENRIAAQTSRRGIGNLNNEVENKVVTAVIDNGGSLDDLKLALSEKLSDPIAWYRDNSV